MEVVRAMLADTRVYDVCAPISITGGPEILSNDSTGREWREGQLVLGKLVKRYSRMRGPVVFERHAPDARKAKPFVIEPVVDTDNPDVANSFGNHSDNASHNLKKSAVIAILWVKFNHGHRQPPP
jgi:hypothetical protein